MTPKSLQNHIYNHYKKTVLLRRAKTAAKAQNTAAKGSFDLSWRVLLRRFYPPVLRCHYTSITAITKNTAINAPFSGVFSFLWQAENRRHMR